MKFDNNGDPIIIDSSKVALIINRFEDCIERNDDGSLDFEGTVDNIAEAGVELDYPTQRRLFGDIYKTSEKLYDDLEKYAPSLRDELENKLV